MPLNYFPDTSVLVNYLADCQHEHLNANKLIQNTGENRQANGFLLNSVQNEFEGISSLDHLSKSIKQVILIVNETKKSNSIPIFIKRIEEMDSRSMYPSQEIVAEEIKLKLNEKQFDATKLKKLAYVIFDEFKQRKRIINEKFVKCIPMQDTEIYQNEALQKIRAKLDECFPARTKNDHEDNAHILNFINYCKTMQETGSFVTCDNLRCRTQEFSERARRIQLTIKNLLDLELYIIKLDEFIRNLQMQTKLN